MSSVVSQTSQDFMYLRLRKVNDTNESIECMVELDEIEELIADPSQYFCGILNFSASLGSSDLYYAAPDGKTMIKDGDGNIIRTEKRQIRWVQNYSHTGNFSQNNIITAIQTRSLELPSYSIVDMFDQLNPSTKRFGLIGSEFKALADGSVILQNTINEKTKKELKKFNSDRRELTRTDMTEVTLNDDLISFLDFQDQPIVRYRSSLTKHKVFEEVIKWFVGRGGLFDEWTSLSQYHLRPTGNFAEGNQNNEQTVRFLIPKEYFAANGIKTSTFEQIRSLFVDETYSEIEVIETRSPAGAVEQQNNLQDSDWCTRGTFRQWRFKETTTAMRGDTNIESHMLTEDVVENFPFVLECRGFVQNQRPERTEDPYDLEDDMFDRAANGINDFHRYQVEDPFLRIIACLFEKYICPAIKVDHVEQGRGKGKPVIGFQHGTEIILGKASQKKFKDVAFKGAVQDNYWGVENEDRKGRYIFINGEAIKDVNLRSNVSAQLEHYGENDLPVNMQASRSRMLEYRFQATAFEAELEDEEEDGFFAGGLRPDQYKITGYLPRNNQENDVNTLVYQMGDKALHKISVDNPLYAYMTQPIWAYHTSNGLTPTSYLDPNGVPTGAGSYELPESGAGHILNQDINTDGERLFERTYALRDQRLTSIYETTGMDEDYRTGYQTVLGAPTVIQGIADTKTTFIYQNEGDEADKIRKEWAIEHALPNQAAQLKVFANEHLGEAEKIAGELIGGVNELCSQLFLDGHKFNFSPPSDLQVKVTPEDIENALGRLNQIRELDKEHCLVYLESSEEKVDLNTMGFYDPDYGKGVDDKSVDFVGDQEPNRIVQFTIINAEDRLALTAADDFEAGRYVDFKNDPDGRWFRADILSWNRKIIAVDGEKTDTFLLNTYLQGDKAQLLAFQAGFRMETIGVTYDEGGEVLLINRVNTKRSTAKVYYRFGNAPSTVKGQIEQQGISQSKCIANQPFRLCAGDYVRSARPNLDSMSYFSSLNITADSGILFKPTFTGNGSRPVLLNIPLETPFSISATDSFRVNGVSLTPRGDVYYSSKDPRIHQMSTNIPLRHARLFLEMQPRDSLIPVKASLAPRGQFEILLGFWKRT